MFSAPDCAFFWIDACAVWMRKGERRETARIVNL